jgi:hypothetical protein
LQSIQLNREIPPELIKGVFELPPEMSDDERAELHRAATELRARAESGDPDAQRDLGCACIWGPESWGDAIPKDDALARHWYVLAAEQGHQIAMDDVAYMLLEGHGGPPDVERGIRYLRFLASRRRQNWHGKDASQLLAWIYRTGAHGIPADAKAANYWEKRARDHERYARGERRKSKSRRIGRKALRFEAASLVVSIADMQHQKVKSGR